MLTGEVNDDIDFGYVNGADTNGGCGAMLKGEYWYFGGENHQSSDKYVQTLFEMPLKIFRYIGILQFCFFKVSKIIGYNLVRQSDIVIDFSLGSCQSFDEPTPKILLCFDYHKTNDCHT